MHRQHEEGAYNDLHQARSQIKDHDLCMLLTLVKSHQGKKRKPGYRCWDTDDQTGESGSTTQVPRIVVARRDDDEECDLEDNRSLEPFTSKQRTYLEHYVRDEDNHQRCQLGKLQFFIDTGANGGFIGLSML